MTSKPPSFILNIRVALNIKNPTIKVHGAARISGHSNHICCTNATEKCNMAMELLGGTIGVFSKYLYLRGHN